MTAKRAVRRLLLRCLLLASGGGADRRRDADEVQAASLSPDVTPAVPRRKRRRLRATDLIAPQPFPLGDASGGL